MHFNIKLLRILLDLRKEMLNTPELTFYTLHLENGSVFSLTNPNGISPNSLKWFQDSGCKLVNIVMKGNQIHARFEYPNGSN